MSNLTNLATKNINDFTVLEDGQAFISQRKAAELCGVSQPAIAQFCLSRKLDVKQGLSDNIVNMLINHYAFDAKQYCTKAARELLKVVSGVGVKAYIYHQAGYTFNAQPIPQLPQTLPEALRAFADEVESHNETKQQLETTNTQLDQSKQYFSIKRVALNNGVTYKAYEWRKLKATGAPIVKIFDANYGNVNAYHLTAWKLAYPDAILPC